MNPLLCPLVFHLHARTPAVSNGPISKSSCNNFFKMLRRSNIPKSISPSFSSSQSWIVARLPSMAICFLLFTTSDVAFDYAFAFGKELLVYSAVDGIELVKWTQMSMASDPSM